jgi:hypothetical protein
VANNVPRLDYPPLGGCPSILVEPQRTNFTARSDDFNNGYWVKQSGTTINSNVTTSPDGTTNADRLVNPGGAGNVRNAPLTLAAGNIIWSVFAKRDSVDFIDLEISGAGNEHLAVFDLLNGTFSGLTGISASIVDYGDGWYRCSVLIAIDGTVGGYRIYTRSNSTTRAAGSVFIWGAQLEEGDNATSYIPTVASTVTRNADVISKTGISDLIGQTEGVLFVESATLTQIEDLAKSISISDGTTNNRIIITYTNNTNQILGQISVLGVTSSIFFQSLNISEFAKIAVRYKANNISLWVNGVKRGVDITSQVLPLNLSRLGLDSGTVFNLFTTKSKSIQLYKTFLTDSEMAQLTTL